ncbi:hypothetical protein [Nocardia pseudovaccinii]|uniref:hypothetical protein n=1 Tax=Nocardia pseudovaccinii TaxID=189540 RepID=UPI0007A3D861|nr:hypothetical protein [Nocardia pseudovaccinii]
MGGLWSELAKKLAEKWLSLLVLPGAFYLAVAGAALTLGHGHALDVGLLAHKITSYAKNPTVTATGGEVVLLVAILAGAAAVGLVAQTVGTFVEHVALAVEWDTWPRPVRQLARWSVARRKRRWDTAETIYNREFRKMLAPDPADRPDSALRHRAARTRTRVAVERPERPTWSGDRVHAAAVRLDRDHHLDLATVWPSVWLILPDSIRDQITDARTALARATTLAAWSVLYSVLTVWWWPAALVGVVAAATARHRIHTATDAYATLLETATRLNAVYLATQLGIDHTGPLTPHLGHVLTRHLGSRRPSAD